MFLSEMLVTSALCNLELIGNSHYSADLLTAVLQTYDVYCSVSSGVCSLASGLRTQLQPAAGIKPHITFHNQPVYSRRQIVRLEAVL